MAKSAPVPFTALSAMEARELVAACMRGWARQAGGDIRMNIGFSISATFGGGMVFNAPQAQFLPGLFIGIQGGLEAEADSIPIGISADALFGFSLHDDKFTKAYEVDAGGSIGWGGSANPINVQIAGVFFIPFNMPGWSDYI